MPNSEMPGLYNLHGENHASVTLCRPDTVANGAHINDFHRIA